MRSSRSGPPASGVGGVVVPRTRMQSDALQLVRRIPAALVPTLRTAVPPLPEYVTARIRAEVPAFGGAGHDRMHRLIREAVTVAVDGFLRIAAGEEECRARVEAHFRGLGWAEAQAGMGVHRVLAAIQVANDSVWQAIHRMVDREELSGNLVADLGVAMSRYLAHLSGEVQRGMAEQRRAMSDVRTRLVLALMQEPSGSQARDVAELAAAAGWSLPEHVVVVVGQLYGQVPGQVTGLPPGALSWMDGDRLVVITVEEGLRDATEVLLRLDPRVQVAQSWAVPLLQARHAYRWARRALALARSGDMRIESRVIPCVRYRMTLWLAADQELARDISQELLAPLLGEKPHHRLMLAETMLRSLETAESAPAMAAYFKTHPQTIRNRMRKLRNLFGDQLDDADQRLALMVALGTALPRWRREQRQGRRR